MATSCCSNCGCNNGSCGCGCAYIVNLPDNPTDIYSAANLNTGGIGVFDSESSFQFGFRGVNSANAMMTVTLDAANKNVLLTLDASAIAAAFPAATTAQVGILETATDAEALAEVAANKILVPSNLAALGATLTFAGLVERATQAEVTAGTDAVRYVAPDTLGVLLATKKQTATWADAVARAALAPTFAGQFGVQLDTDQGYVSYGVAAGQWYPLMTFNANAIVPNGSTNGLQMGTATLDVADGAFSFTNSTISGDGVAITLISNSSLQVSGGIFDLDSSEFRIGGAATSANTVICTGAVAGDLTDRLLSTFISTANVQTGYTNFTNPAVLRTCDTTTVTTAQLAQIVGTLINDLKAVLLPAT